ncbi:MAG: hypothetical protein LBB24_01525 [Rickettsiales bacterium]|nr:hypothetical protein [Rickettsiales bacterium]
MANKSMEALGEKSPDVGAEDDNYLADNKVLTISFTENTISKDEKALATLRRILTFIFAIPILIGAVFTALYFLLKIGPSILFFIRNFFLGLSKM